MSRNRPVQLAQSVPSVVVDVETSPGSGQFRPDARLRADRVELTSDDAISQATISVRLDNDFDLLAAKQRYLPDCRVVIRTDEVSAADRTILFEGYPTLQESIREGNPKRTADSYVLEAVHVQSRLAQDRRCWIFGRQMRNGEIIDGLESDPDMYASRSAHVESLPCVFNLDGRGNRSPDPVIVVDGMGLTRRIPIFAHDVDAEAVEWSFADVLRYLVWFHHLPEGPVSIQSVLDLTEPAVGVDPNDRGAFVPPSGAVDRLVAVADDLNCEATNLVEALALLAQRAGVHVTCVTENVEGMAVSRLEVWAPQDGVAKSLGLVWGGRYADGSRRYDTAELGPGDIFEDNELRRVELLWNQGEIVNAPMVVGDTKRHEMTVPLVPGWLPEENLDNVAPPDRDAAKDMALTPDLVEYLGDDAELVPWYRKYHRCGSEFEEYRDVARLWVLNEDGALAGALYNRNSPFDNYGPFDFTTVADETVTSPGLWVRCPRPMQSPVTVAEDGSKYSVYVQVSYDSGATWYSPCGSVTVLKDRAGIWFGLPNPTAMAPPGYAYEVQNMWYALIDQTFRVRATAVFESDARVGAMHQLDSSRTPTLWTNSRLIYKPNLYRFASRFGTTDVLAEVNPDGEGIEVDDTASAMARAEAMAEDEQGGLIETTATIPWLDDTFDIGDRITGLRGRGVSIDGPLRVAALGGCGWNVMGKTYVLSGGKLSTALKLARTLRNV